MPSRERNTRKFEPLQNLFALNGMLMIMTSHNLMHTILMIPSSGETQSAGYWLEKGNELCNSGQMEEAIKAYEFALSLDATLIDAWNNKGLILANQNCLDEALRCFDEVLKISPRHAYTLSNKGMVLAQQKKYQDALDCFEAAIVVDPYFAGAWYNKALAMQCLGRDREAMAAMKTADQLEGKAVGCRRRC